MTREEMANRLEQVGLIAILRLDRPELARPIVAELIEGGVGAIEFSLAGSDALDALAACTAEFEGQAQFGAGTVLSEDHVARTVDAGASFLVSPNLDEAVMSVAADAGVLHIPGAMTPTEVALADKMGALLIKLFPAGVLGPAYVRQLLGPFPDMRLVATGGVTLDNAADFFSAGAAAVAVAGHLVDRGTPDVPSGLAEKSRRFVDLIATAGGSR